VQIFLDSANIAEIREAASWGILSGVTISPTLLAHEPGADLKATIQEIATLVEGPISTETTALDAEGMAREGHEYYEWNPERVIIKLPSTIEGLKAVYTLAKEGIRTHVTFCFNANQALFAARAGAFIVGPLVGDLDDTGAEGMQLVREIVQIYRNDQTIKTKILSASIRSPRQLIDAALAGADIATCPLAVLLQAMRHPFTDSSIATSLADWQGRQ